MEKDVGKGVKKEITTLSPQVCQTIWENAYKSASLADIREDRGTFDTNLRCTVLLQDKKNPNSLKFDDREKAEILQEQFCSVFTKEQLASQYQDWKRGLTKR